MWIPNDPRETLPGRVGSDDDRKTIDQSSATPVNQFLAEAMQAVLGAERPKEFSSHVGRSMMRPIENLRFDERLCYGLRKSLAEGTRVFTEIGMMKKSSSADFQFRSQLAQIRFDDVPFRVNERIETEHEIDARIGNHRKRATVVDATPHP